MHRLWEVPEMLLAVMEVSDRQSRGRTAQVNHWFWSHITQTLWEEIPGTSVFEPLVPCATMVLERRDADSHYCKRPNRLAIYSDFIKNIVKPLDDAGFALLLHLRSVHGIQPVPLPNLTNIRFVSYRLSGFEDMASILPETLQTLHIQTTSSHAVDPPLSEFLNHKFHSMKTLSVQSSQHDIFLPDTCQQLSRFARGNPSLTRLVFEGPIRAVSLKPIIATASTLPHLQELGIEVDENWNDAVTFPLPGAFPSLKWLRITGLTVSMSGPLTLLNQTRVETMELIFLGYGVADDGLIGLGEGFRNLKSISIGVDRGTMTFETLRPTLSCQTLTHFWLDIADQPFHLDDSNILAMAQAWPLLQNYRLEALDGKSNVPSSVTLHGLQCLGRLCPNLETLYVTANAREIGAESVVEHPCPSVKDLCLGWTVLNDNVEAVATFIDSMWPNHRTASTKWRRLTVFNQWEVIWGLVREKKVLRAADRGPAT